MGVAGPNRRGQRSASRPKGARKGPRAAGVAADGLAGGGDDNGAAAAAGEREPGRLVFDIASDFASGRDVQQRIMAAVERGGFNADSTFAIRIALEEALVNAIKHGNRLDRGKRVHVEAQVRPGYIEVEIEDQGTGFDRAGVPDPTANENLCRPSGRGILLIESYMSSVRWDRGGRRLRMSRDNRPLEFPIE